MWLAVVLMLAQTPDEATSQRREHELLAYQTVRVLDEIHPGWKKYEPQMLALGNKLGPQRGTGPVEYLRLLYGIAVVMEASPKKLDEVLKPKEKK